MSRPAPHAQADAPPREGSLDDVGACLVGIMRIASASGDLVEEEARAVFSLACLALSEWRLLDAAADVIGDGK